MTRKFITLIVLFIASVLVFAAPVAATPPQNEVSGTFFTQVFDASFGCTSPTGFCAVGTVTGDITGDVDVELTQAQFTFDPTGTFPIRLDYVTSIVITSKNGTLSGQSFGTIDYINTVNGLPSLKARFELTDGTGYYTNRRGTLFVDGTSNPVTGQEVLPFVGTLSVVPASQQ